MKREKASKSPKEVLISLCHLAEDASSFVHSFIILSGILVRS